MKPLHPKPRRENHWWKKAQKIRDERKLYSAPSVIQQSLRRRFPSVVFERWYANARGEVFGTMRDKSSEVGMQRRFRIVQLLADGMQKQIAYFLLVINEKEKVVKIGFIGKEREWYNPINVRRKPMHSGYQLVQLAIDHAIMEAKKNGFHRIMGKCNAMRVPYYARFGFRVIRQLNNGLIEMALNI